MARPPKVVVAVHLAEPGLASSFPITLFALTAEGHSVHGMAETFQDFASIAADAMEQIRALGFDATEVFVFVASNVSKKGAAIVSAAFYERGAAIAREEEDNGGKVGRRLGEEDIQRFRRLATYHDPVLVAKMQTRNVQFTIAMGWAIELQRSLGNLFFPRSVSPFFGPVEKKRTPVRSFACSLARIHFGRERERETVCR